MVKIKDITTKVGSGSTPRGGQRVYQDSGTTLIRSQNIYDFSFAKEGLVFINDEAADKLKNVTLQEKDILLNITGDSVGRCCIVPNELLPARVNQHVAIIRTDSNNSAEFLLYALNEKRTKERLLNQVHGGTRKALTKGIIEEFNISIPSFEEQKSIASILWSLDEKIQLNHMINNTLEEIAMNLYRYWFVDFIPFKDKPFKKTDLGQIPVEWEIGRLGDLISVQNGYAFKSSQWQEEGIPVVKIKNIAPPIISLKDVAFVNNDLKENLDRFLLRKGDYLIGMTGAEIGKCGVFFNEQEAFLNQRVGRIRSNIKEFNPIPLVYLFTRLPDFKQKVLDRATGSAQPNISNSSIEDIPILLPPTDLLSEFITLINDQYNALIHNYNENHNLEIMRDYLLPRLTSGEIEIPQAAKIVKEVLLNEQPESSV